VLICYDREDDNTLTAIRKHRDALVRSRSSLYATSSAVHTAQCDRFRRQRGAVCPRDDGG
jgi:hypothetical protein